MFIFAPFKAVLRMLMSELEKDYRCVVFDGDTPVNLRAEYVRDFQAGLIDIIIGHPKTLGYGVTLTAAHTAIWYSPHMSPEVYAQANERLDRPGQTVPVTLVRMFSSPVEERVYKRMIERLDWQEELLIAIGRKHA